ncbi:MAG: hypothetical protein ACRDMV_23785 [Streptosporangiales bacterium]
MIDLALATGIPPSVWAAEGQRAILTAYQLLEDREKGKAKADGRQMSG